MRILVMHNRYQQPGGEDAVALAETAMLRARGHEVMLLEENNDAIVGTIASLGTAFSAVYSRNSLRKVRGCIEHFRPDVAHVHNFFPKLSPSVYDACAESGVPVVQTLHNYRLLCANANLYRNNEPCEACLGKSIPWPGIWNRCYRGSRCGSAVLATMQVVHKVRSTWTRKVDKYVALTDFARRKFVSAGLPASMIACKPNFVPTDPGVGSGDGGYVLFVGRLSAEKGISTLLAAWQMLSLDRKLKIAGDGPMRTSVGELANRCSNIEWLGRRSDAEVFDLMRSAVAVVCPSEWYEGFPLVVIEAFASGAPVIASRIGGLGEIIEHGRTGLLFAPGSAKGLVEAIEWAFTHSSEMGLMRRSARAEYETKYTPERNYRMLMDIYRSAGVVTSDDR